MTELASELPLAAADIYRLEQAFLNLMINAIQAMEAQGGTLTIRTQASDGHVDIAFADTGPGILESHLPLIFKPFFTTKGRDGNGLGLHGCRRIVEDEHRGRIEVTSRLGEGTTFTLRIPQGARG